MFFFWGGREPWSSGYGRRLTFRGSNPGTIYWMDMTFFHIDVYLKRTKINKKEAGVGAFKKSLV